MYLYHQRRILDATDAVSTGQLVQASRPEFALTLACATYLGSVCTVHYPGTLQINSVSWEISGGTIALLRRSKLVRPLALASQ